MSFASSGGQAIGGWSLANVGSVKNDVRPVVEFPGHDAEDDSMDGGTIHSARYSLNPADYAPPRALLFELGNVLHDATLWQRWLWQLLARMGTAGDFASFCRTWHERYLPGVHCGEVKFADAFRRFLIDGGLSCGQIDEVEAASSARRREIDGSLRPLPGVARTLARLTAAGLAFGVLADSDRTADELRRRVESLRLSARFDCVISSRDLRQCKPWREGYRAAIEALELPACEVAFVGCRTADLAGAAAAGLRTFAINHESDAVATVLLRRFDDLLTHCLPLPLAAAG